jgi:hypothetical protein
LKSSSPDANGTSVWSACNASQGTTLSATTQPRPLANTQPSPLSNQPLCHVTYGNSDTPHLVDVILLFLLYSVHGKDFVKGMLTVADFWHCYDRWWCTKNIAVKITLKFCFILDVNILEIPSPIERSSSALVLYQYFWKDQVSYLDVGKY